MLVRRIVALFTMLSLLHLTVATGDTSCASHSAPATTTSGNAVTAAHAGHDMGPAAAPSSGASVANGDGAPLCDRPANAACCDAMVTCAEHGVACGARGMTASPPEPASRIAAALADAPSSFAPAPEPPPPKA